MRLSTTLYKASACTTYTRTPAHIVPTPGTHTVAHGLLACCEQYLLYSAHVSMLNTYVYVLTWCILHSAAAQQVNTFANNSCKSAWTGLSQVTSQRRNHDGHAAAIRTGLGASLIRKPNTYICRIWQCQNPSTVTELTALYVACQCYASIAMILAS